jgi:CHAD domain-containing protein
MLLSDQFPNRARIDMPAELHRNTSPSPLLPGVVRETEWQFDAQDLNAVRALLASRPEIAGFRLIHQAPRHLTDRYFDTADALLARAGYALRLRHDASGDQATLKSLHSESRGPVVRQEINQSLDQGSMTALLATEGPVADRVRAVAGSAPLQPLFTVRTHRDVFQAMRGEMDAAEIVLDNTEVRTADKVAWPGARPVAALRRVEVELHDALAETMQPLIVELCDAAALAPAKLSKFAAGLAASGRELPARAVPLQPVIEPAMPAVAVGQALLRQQLDAWREIEPAVRLGDDAEALHQLRVTGRRIVAMLRLLEAVPVGGVRRLRRRVQALLRRTGALRDLDVQRIELDALNATLTQRQLQPLVEKVGRQRMKQQRFLVRLLDSARVRQLFTAVETVATATPARGARIPIATVARRQVRRRYRRVRQQALSMADRASIEQCHQLRLETKKLRYLAEPFAAFYSEPMQRFLRRLRRLQSLLGCINDSHHAIASLERQITQRRRLPAAALFAMGRVAAQHQHRMNEAGDELSRAWRRCSGKVWRRLRRRLRERVPQSQQTGPPRA